MITKKKKTMKESDKVIGEIRQELGSREVKESGFRIKESGSMEVKESGSRRVKELQSWRGLIEAGDELCCGAAQKEGFRICADYMVGRLMKMPVDMAVLQVMEWNGTREDMNATREKMG